MQTISKSKLSLLFIILVIIYAWHTSIPYIGFQMPALINVGLLLLMFAIMIADHKFSVAKAFQDVIPLYLLSILPLLTSPLSQWPEEIYGLVQRIAFPIIALYVVKNGSQKDSGQILIFVLLGYIITCVTTYIGCMAYPGAARQMAKGMIDSDYGMFNLYRQLNIGSFAFVYTIVLLLPFALYTIRNKTHNFIIYFIFTIVAGMAIVVTEYTTALLLMLAISLIFLLPKNFTSADLKRKWVLLVFICILVWILLPMFLDAIIPYIDRQEVSDRLGDLSAFLQGNEIQSNDNDIEQRSSFYMISINGFLSSPIWGTFNISGGHSLLLDTLSKYGLIGLILIMIMYKRAYTLYIKPYKNQPFFGYILFVFMMTLLLAIINPKDNLLVLTFLIPLFGNTYFNQPSLYNYENTLDSK